MRSKQQPRPSYRWLNKTTDDNEDNDENAESQQDGDQPDPINNPPKEDGPLTPRSTDSASPNSSQRNTPDSSEKIQTNIVGSDLSSQAASIMLRDPESLLLNHHRNANLRHHQHHRIRRDEGSHSPSPPHNALSQHQQSASSLRRSGSSEPLSLAALQQNLIDSQNDDVEHRIPATLIHDTGATTEREMASPRCPSRDSTSDHSPSEDSVYSGRNMHMPPNAVSPVGIALPATIPPPSVPAAMAAYLGAAAAAAQQNRILLGSSLAGLAKVSVSPLPLTSPLGGDTPILDFSTKRKSKSESNDEESDNDAVNLCKTDTSGALDLSVGSRKRSTDEPVTPVHSRKMSRSHDYKPNVSPWTSPVAPYLAAAVAAANMSPKNTPISEWNGKNKIPASVTNDATKALEKMSELSRLGGEDLYKSSGGNSVSSSGGRHSAWQSHWLNKGADSTKDVLKCVWCKQSFPTLAAMSTHMRETKHCNVNAPPSSNNLAPPQSNTSASNQSHSHSSHSASSNHRERDTSSSNETRSKPSQSELNLLIKETMPIPRKLVRGQDVWLGKGAEQTRQILKCMWCGQSFRSLAEMTNHMQQTQHYTNIISQEQIISWKSSDGSSGGGGSGGPGGNSGNGQGGGGSSSTVSAVLTCKVCTKSFNSLKELSDHMVKHDHYKEHIMRSISESTGRRRQTREKRKKSLPVRKLLELERAQHDFKNGDTPPLKSHEPPIMGSRITCEKCNEKIDTMVFVEHIRQCVGGGLNTAQKNLLKSALTSNAIISPDSMGPLTPNSRDGRKSIGDEMSSPITRHHISPSNPTDLSSPNSKEGSIIGGGGGGGNDKSSSPSVLNAIEQLIEKSFDTKSRHPGFAGPNQSAAPLGSSILKRLGIDESVDYTKPLIDPQTMNFLRSYQQHQNAHPFGRRERSGSESSSVSDRGSSRMDSLTPERKLDHNISQSTTPRTTPDKLEGIGGSSVKSEMMDHHGDDSSVRIKKEPIEDDVNCDESAIRPAGGVSIKREQSEDERPESRHETMSNHHGDDNRRNSRASTPARSPRRTPIHPSPIPSPASERSVTPRSTPGISDTKKMMSGGSLGALSSMFDSLTGSNAPGSSVDGHSGGSSQKKQNAHPLAALQKLCDKTETNQQSSRTNSLTANPATSSASSSSSTPSSMQAGGGSGTSASGAMVAFSWACNDAVVTADSIMKCAYCDTPFISKGAYRHHLSKMHFVKDDVIPDPVAIKSQKQIPPPSPHSPKNNNDRHTDRHGGRDRGDDHRHNERQMDRHRSDNGLGQSTKSPPHSSASTSGNNPSSTSTTNASNNGNPSGGGGNSSNNNAGAAAAAAAFEESPHSKFLKYTELAKQLSSKYV